MLKEHKNPCRYKKPEGAAEKEKEKIAAWKLYKDLKKYRCSKKETYKAGRTVQEFTQERKAGEKDGRGKKLCFREPQI